MKPIEICAALLILATIGCAPYVKVTPLSPLTLAPTKTCEVFTTSEPNKPFTELALIELYEDRGDPIAIAQNKAMALGADAIYLKSMEAVGGTQVRTGTYAGATHKLVFVAIKWK